MQNHANLGELQQAELYEALRALFYAVSAEDPDVLNAAWRRAGIVLAQSGPAKKPGLGRRPLRVTQIGS